MSATVYLIHAERKLAHALHYIGCTEQTIEQRLRRHSSTKTGARLLLAMRAAGIAYDVVRTWICDSAAEGYALEKRLKGRKNAPRQLCPICRKEMNGHVHG